MKTVKLFSITGLFFMACIFGACNPHAPNNTGSTMSSEGLDNPSVTNTKNDSTTHNDTIITPASKDSINKNNPDITK